MHGWVSAKTCLELYLRRKLSVDRWYSSVTCNVANAIFWSYCRHRVIQLRLFLSTGGTLTQRNRIKMTSMQRRLGFCVMHAWIAQVVHLNLGTEQNHPDVPIVENLEDLWK
eukprot:scaffold18029_cov31-Prasinocladus_malaysianus.AAC.1